MPDSNMSNTEAPVESLSQEPVSTDVSPELAAQIDAALATEFPTVSDAEPTPEELAARPDEEAAPAAEAPAEQPPADAAPPAGEEPPPPQVEDNALSRGLAALARQEKELQLQKREAKDLVFQAQQRVQQLEQELAVIRRQAVEDPAGHFKALGVPEDQLADFAAQLYVSAMGDKAPKELVSEIRAKQHAIAARREVAILRNQAEQDRAVARAQAQEAQALSYLGTVVMSIPESLPFFRAEAREDPGLAARAMLQRIKDLGAAGEFQPGTPDDVMAAMAAQSINNQLKARAERDARVYSPLMGRSAAPPVTAPPKNPAPAAEKKLPAQTPKTLSNKNAPPISAPKKPAASRQELEDELVQELKQGKHLNRL